MNTSMPQGAWKTEKTYPTYDEYPTAPHADLWTRYTPEETVFTLWSPVAEEVVVRLFDKGDGGSSLATHPLQKKEQGLWLLKLSGDQHGLYYTYQVKVNGRWLNETPGIYARAVGVNGKRAMVLDLATTNPEDWEKDQGPVLKSPNDAVLYEVHIRDLTQHPNSGSSMPGKYLGLTETGATNPEGLPTGFDHIRELGVTHVHLLPAFDYSSVDEADLHTPQYNWGYDPLNYNVPEGSYSSDPFRAEVRIREFKQMVKNFHDQGIGVVLDVVYNHTGLTEDAGFNLEVPGYYYRHTKNGHWSNASGCGNETASERTMMRKFMLESCTYWAREYHVDGFRFDLMGIHDIETMNLLAAELRKINPSILLYGEGWTAGPSPLPAKKKALKANTHQLQGIAAFSDDLRDGLKGSVFEDTSRGFVSGAKGMEESVKFGLAGCINHPQLDFHKVNYSAGPWAKEPVQSVSYVSCHDNQTLYDKLKISCKEASEEEITRMHLLANAVVLTAQGIPFLHAGVEILRMKQGEHNSYNLPDAINQIDWQWKTKNIGVFNYYQKLIQLRKMHPAFRMPSAQMLNSHLSFLETKSSLIGYQLKEHANGDSWKNIRVYYNGSKTAAKIPTKGEWQLAVEGEKVDLNGIRSVTDQVMAPPIAMLILFQA